jgi:hypothetical protein
VPPFFSEIVADGPTLATSVVLLGVAACAEPARASAPKRVSAIGHFMRLLRLVIGPSYPDRA